MDNGACSYRRFLDGDDNGLVEIVRDYKDGLIFYLNGFVENISVAEELTEETFVKIVTKRPRFHERSSFKTWLYAIGRNAALDYTRRSTRHVELPYESCQELIAEEEELERAYIREERAITVHRAMRSLKPEYRQVLWLIYFEGFSNKEAAIVMKKTTHNIETLVYRARLSLRSKLDEEGFIYEEL